MKCWGCPGFLCWACCNWVINGWYSWLVFTTIINVTLHLITELTKPRWLPCPDVVDDDDSPLLYLYLQDNVLSCKRRHVVSCPGLLTRPKIVWTVCFCICFGFRVWVVIPMDSDRNSVQNRGIVASGTLTATPLLSNNDKTRVRCSWVSESNRITF